MHYLFIFVCNIIIFFSIHFFLKKFSANLKIIDYPSHRKKHQYPATLSGGLCILIPVYIFNIFLDTNLIINFILYISILVLILGLFDDIFNLSAKLRLAILLIISFIVFYYGINLNNLGQYYGIGSLEITSFSIFFTVISIIILTNAINFIDGIDGLAISLILQALISLFLFIYINNQVVLDTVVFLLIINCILFFLINTEIIQLSKSFLGDSGSMSLGFILACLLIYYSQNENNYLHPILVIWCIPILIFDFFATIFQRIKIKRNPLKADRLHIHNKLLSNNNSKIVLIKILTISVVLNFIGAVSFYMFNATVSLIVLLVSFTIYLFFKMRY